MTLNKPKVIWFAAFTAVFAVCAAIVFWGSWGPNMGFVAPDNDIFFPHSYSDTLLNWWNMFATTGKAHPFDVLWSGLIGSSLTCCQLRYVVSSYCGALAMAWFLHGRGLSPISSYGAGLLFAFSGYGLTLYSAGHGNWFVWISYGVFAFGLLDRAVKGLGFRYWALLGLVEAWASFYVPDVWLLFALFIAAYAVFRFVQIRAFPMKGVLVAAVVFLAVSAPSIYSAFAKDLSGRDEQIEKSKGTSLAGDGKEDADARWIFATNWSLPPAETLEFFIPRINGDTSCPLTLSIGRQLGTGVKPYTGALGRPYGATVGNYRQHSLYVGLVTCLLALCGLLSMFKKFNAPSTSGAAAKAPSTSTILFFAISAVVFWLFSLGRYCEPVYRLVYAMPFGDYLRAPVKWHHLTEFCIAVLAGFGIEHVLCLVERMKFSRIVVAAIVVFGALNLAYVAHFYCAPVDYSRAVLKRCSSRLAVLSRQQLVQPRLAELVRGGYVVSVANWIGGNDALLVQVLEPTRPLKPEPLKTIPFCLGLFSVFAAIVTIGVSIKSSLRRGGSANE